MVSILARLVPRVLEEDEFVAACSIRMQHAYVDRSKCILTQLLYSLVSSKMFLVHCNSSDTDRGSKNSEIIGHLFFPTLLQLIIINQLNRK